MTDGDGDDGAHERPQRGAPWSGRDGQPDRDTHQANVQEPSRQVDDAGVENEVARGQGRLQHGDPRDRADADGDREGVDRRRPVGPPAARPHDHRRRRDEGDRCTERKPRRRAREGIGPTGRDEEAIDQGRDREQHHAQRQQQPGDPVARCVSVNPEQDRDRHEATHGHAELPWHVTGHGGGDPGHGGDEEPHVPRHPSGYRLRLGIPDPDARDVPVSRGAT